ncbi:hypothetical protein E3V08_00430 [Candidatus Atribacteria bacterium MT.SAG.1]|nr:hypothetical protein E3V08_00430 [Candidatus Atribacteria bacterium MT.SAG.1]
MKKLLFLGCNYAQIPYLKIAKDKGYYVVGTDINQNAPGIKYLDKYYSVGYESVDKLIELGNRERFSSCDKVFTASSQFAYIGASIFAENFNIPFLDPKAVDICLDKIKLYELFIKQNLDVPEWMVFDNNKINNINKKWKVFYLKSDYGKSPNYCYRVKDNTIPKLPQKYDRYFRKYFIAQEDILGNHFRINWIKDDSFCFFKVSDRIALPVYFIDLGGEVCKNMNNLIYKLGFQNHLVKFDVIYTEEKCYFIDIGLEPPMRLRLYLQYLGYNFDKIYFEHIVEYNLNYPKSFKLPKNVIIKNKIVESIVGDSFE